LLAVIPSLYAAEISGGGGVARTGLKPPDRVAEPKLAPASDDWKSAMQRFQIPANFKVDLFAAEPLLGNPVAFTMDEQGRAFVSETYRYRTSTLDIRHYMFMLEDDLACRTTDDRIASTKKNFPSDWQKLEVETEVVRLVEDRDKDGKADFSAPYASGMNTILDGINSGVIAREGQVWCTNMPNLWHFSGMTKDGVAEKRESLSFGYGVRFSFTGHDMHGLIFGPDGRLYFSFGDRGAYVKTKEGRTLAFSDEGAVFRCEPDGTKMEMVMHGLRNPQELAFDNHGNLFTGDNDSDQGDRERWVYVVDGADAGWRVGWQHHPIGKELNPWLAEKMWEPRNPSQPAAILPPIANVPDGPSGLAFYPGTGLPAKYEGTFFLCGFKGSSARSAVSSWKVKPNGASFDLVDQEVFINNVQATDIMFGPDSKIYFSEWGEGWEGVGKGRLFKMWDPQTIQDPQVGEVQKLLAEGFSKRSPQELGRLLAHRDQRVRLEAQWALAKDANGAAVLLEAAQKSGEPLARLHGIWGIGHVARLAGYKTPQSALTALQPLLPLLLDKDPEVRAQTARTLGDTLGGVIDFAPQGSAPSGAALTKSLLPLLKDTEPRVQFMAAQAIAKVATPDAAEPVIALIRTNSDKDAYLRHAGVIALTATKNSQAIAAAAKDPDAAVRMAALLSMRRAGSPEIAQFLTDKDPNLVLEAARAINDAPINAALPQLAALLNAPVENQPLMLRAINAAFRAGTPAGADALAAYAAREDAPELLRLEAVRQLAQWAKPFARDRVVGVFRPLQDRDGAPAVAALGKVLPQLIDGKSGKIAEAAVEAVADLNAKELGGTLVAYVDQEKAPAKARIKALQTLSAFKHPKLAEAVKHAIDAKDAGLRIEALALLGQLDPDEAVKQLSIGYGSAGVPEKKAIITALGDLKSAGADKQIAVLLDDLIAGKAQPEIQLELIEAADKRADAAVKAKLSQYQNSLPKDNPVAAAKALLAGGNREAGEKLFKEHAVAQCFRCHKVKGAGGDAGPELTKVASTKDRTYILQSILDPNASIAEGFQMSMITTKKGDIIAGMVKAESPESLTLQIPGAAPVKVAVADVAKRETAPSGMPPIGAMLSQREIRDIVEYVASLK
jgi:quinoprotein glucose dehydrogenase